MGSYYAEASGENEQVARAIADHYRPRFSRRRACPRPTWGASWPWPTSWTRSAACSPWARAPRARRTRSRCAAAPSASRPCWRRACPCRSWGPWTPRSPAYADAGIDFDRDDVRAQVADFFVTRTKVMLRDSGASPDAIDAVLAAGVEEPAAGHRARARARGRPHRRARGVRRLGHGLRARQQPARRGAGRGGGRGAAWATRSAPWPLLRGTWSRR